MFWFHEELERLEKIVKEKDYQPNLVFYGSSTFTLWEELTTLFEEYNPVNLGFGGSTLASCTWFFERIFKDIETVHSIIIYAGDNDLGEGRHPEEVVLFLENLLHKIQKKHKNISCACISIKPSIARKHLMPSIHYTNKCIKELMTTVENGYFIDIYDSYLDKSGNPDWKYFEEDGLHFNQTGYKVLEAKIKENLAFLSKPILQKT